MIVTGSTMFCPACGDGIELTITLGPSERVGDQIPVAVGFDADDFRRRFEAHVMAAPTEHPEFVLAADDTP